MENLLSNPYIIKTLQSIALILIVSVLAKIAISISTKNTKRSSEAPYIIKYTAIFFFGISLIFIWLEGLGPVLTALTIVAAALTIVSKEMIVNFLGSFVIFWRELFAIGDRVQVGEHSGDVIDKGVLYFTLLEVGRTQSTGHSTGRLIKIPNAQALTFPVINATRGAGYVWDEIEIAVTRSSDWEKARQLLLGIVEEYFAAESIDLDKVKASFQRRNIFFNKLTPKVYVSVSTDGIRLTLRYLCRSRMMRESEDFITTRFLQRMKADGIELAEEQ